jgi:anti-sigma factor RsiW
MSEPKVPGMSITCEEVVEIVTDYLEGAVDDATRAELEAHLALCPHCQRYLDQMRETIEELGRVPVETLNEQAQRDLVAAFRTYRAPDSPAR